MRFNGKSEKKTLYFPEGFVARDFKVGRYKKPIELMNLCKCSRLRLFHDLGKRSFTIKKLKLNFLRNHLANQSQTSLRVF